jgi:hypothetical protein
MTPAQPALDEMMEGVTAGPWSASPVDPRRICDHRGLSVARAHLLGNYGTIEEAAANAAFIAAARELVPALAAEVRAQRETIAGLTARVEALTAHIAANCRICNGTGIAGGSGSTNPVRTTIYPCNHGIKDTPQ